MTLRKNTIWNLVGSFVPLIAAVVFIPYCLDQLGSEAFGILTLIWALIGYFSLFDFGIGRALTCEISRLAQAGMKGQRIAVMRAGMLLTLVTGLLGGVVMWILAPYLAADWLGITSNFQSDALQAFQVAAVGVVFTTIASALRGTQEGLERFRTANINKIVMGLCTFSLPALSIELHGAVLYPIVVYLVAARLLILILNAFQLRDYLFGTGIGSMYGQFRSLYSFGAWVSVSGLIGPLMVYGDRFFVSAAVGATLLPLYAIPQEALQRLLLIPGAFCGALLPRLSGLPLTQQRLLFSRSYKQLAWGMLLVCGGCAAIAYQVLSIWLSPEFASNSIHLVLILFVGMWINSVAMVPFTFLHANGNARLTAIFHIVELVVYIASLFYLVDAFGLIGAALAWVLRVAMDCTLLHLAVMDRSFISK